MNIQSIEAGFKDNSYLRLAHRAILRARRPLTPTEMLALADAEGFKPSHLFGGTMHKTLSARLAEYIRSESGNSAFYRTAPATFFLHSLAASDETPLEYKKVFVGHLRAKSIRKENVLVAPKDELESQIYGDYIPFDEGAFNSFFKSHCKFLDRSVAENDDTVKQFVTFTLVFHGAKILIYRRGKFTTTSDTLKGQMSVGFGGHVNDTDFDLFNKGADAFRNNAARELREELFLDDVYRDRDEATARTNVMGYVNVDDSPDARHHIAVLVAFEHRDASVPKKGELSINQLSWLNLADKRNDLSDFDLWSGMILRNLYEGKIKIPRSHADAC